MNAATWFEKARMQATYTGDTAPPNEKDLQTILKSLSGNDTETKPSTAFQTLVNKLKTSDSRKYWNYLMKNLVILDRAVDEGHFVGEIAYLEIPGVEEYQQKQQRYKERKIEELVSAYFRFIRDKADVFSRKKTCLKIPKDKRKQYFKGMPAEDILEENRALNSLYQSAFEVFNTGSSGHLKYKLNQYVFLVVLSSIMNILSTQYVAFIVIIETFFDMDSYMAHECYRAFQEFLKTTEDLIVFTGNHQFIPGFQISLHELRNPTADAKLLNAMKEYIDILDDDTHGLGERKVTDPFTFNREELQPKKSEINIADFAGAFQAEKGASDEIASSPVRDMSPIGRQESASPERSTTQQNASNKDQAFFGKELTDSEVRSKVDRTTISSEMSDSTKLKSERPTLTSPTKTRSAAFEKTFEIGYHGLITLDNNALNENLIQEYTAEEEQDEEQKPVETKTIRNEDDEEEEVVVVQERGREHRHLTTAFKRFTVIEHDHIFENFQNGYSPEWDDTIFNTRFSQNKALNMFEFQTQGIVMTHFNDSNKEEISMTDFRPEIFSKFQNLYSSEFRM